MYVIQTYLTRKNLLTALRYVLIVIATAVAVILAQRYLINGFNDIRLQPGQLVFIKTTWGNQRFIEYYGHEEEFFFVNVDGTDTMFRAGDIMNPDFGYMEASNNELLVHIEASYTFTVQGIIIDGGGYGTETWWIDITPEANRSVRVITDSGWDTILYPSDCMSWDPDATQTNMVCNPSHGTGQTVVLYPFIHPKP